MQEWLKRIPQTRRSLQWRSFWTVINELDAFCRVNTTIQLSRPVVGYSKEQLSVCDQAFSLVQNLILTWFVDRSLSTECDYECKAVYRKAHEEIGDEWASWLHGRGCGGLQFLCLLSCKREWRSDLPIFCSHSPSNHPLQCYWTVGKGIPFLRPRKHDHFRMPIALFSDLIDSSDLGFEPNPFPLLDSTNTLSQAYASYVRRRCHRIAVRFLQLFQQERRKQSGFCRDWISACDCICRSLSSRWYETSVLSTCGRMFWSRLRSSDSWFGVWKVTARIGTTGPFRTHAFTTWSNEHFCRLWKSEVILWRKRPFWTGYKSFDPIAWFGHSSNATGVWWSCEESRFTVEECR